MYEKSVNSIIRNVITYWLAAGFIEDEPKLLTCSIIQGCSSIESVLYLCCRYHKETLASQKFYQQAVVARIFKLAPSKSQSRLLDCLWSTALHTVSFVEFCSGQQRNRDRDINCVFNFLNDFKDRLCTQFFLSQCYLQCLSCTFGQN